MGEDDISTPDIRGVIRDMPSTENFAQQQLASVVAVGVK
jgi:hypothetical protein